MGSSDKDTEREDMASWLKQHETVYFFNKLRNVKVEIASSLAKLNTTGDQLVKDYYRTAGMVIGLEYAEELAHELIEGEVG